MKVKALAAAVATALVVIGGTTAADARRAKPAQTMNWSMSWEQPATQRVQSVKKRRYAKRGYRSGYASRKARGYSYASRQNRAQSYSYRIASHTGVGPRPGRWCGWWMRTQRGGGPEYNLAWNWRKYGSPAAGPQVGAVVVWRHHVGEIVGQAANGRWIVRSGNDGGRVRERARSVSGAIFRI